MHFAYAFNDAYIDKTVILTSMPSKYLIKEVHDDDIIRYFPGNEAWKYLGDLKLWSLLTEKTTTEELSESKPTNIDDATFVGMLKEIINSDMSNTTKLVTIRKLLEKEYNE